MIPAPPSKPQEVSLKNSLLLTRNSNVVLRLTRFILPAILAGGMATGCGPQTPPSPQGQVTPQTPQAGPAPQAPQTASSGLIGQWRTVIAASTVNGVPVAGGTITISIAANGQYDQTGVPQNVSSGGTQTMQAGPYQLTAPNTIHFTVTDWSPKTRWNFVPNPRCGVPGVPNPTNARRDSCNTEQEWTLPQPPGTTYAYTFNGPNTLMLKNQAGSYTFTRMAAQ